MSKKSEPMTDEEVVALLAQAAEESLGAHDGELADDIERANDYYMGKPYGDEVDGRSKFVTREVMEVIEGMMPYLVKVFFSSDQACVFEPEDEDDIAGAEQETEYVNWVFYKDNPGFEIGYDWLKDGLMNKIGIVKAVREGRFGPTTKTYENLDEQSLMLLLADMDESDVEDVELEQDEETGLFDAKIKVDLNEHRTAIYNVPPENFRISDSSRNIETAYYVAETYERSISDLRAMGFDVDDDISDSVTRDTYGTVKISRHEDVDDENIGHEGADRKGPSRVVNVWEEYIYLDANGDGITELLKIIRVGDTILEKVEVESRPYHAWGPYRIPHKFHGLSAADVVMDIQRLKSRLWRNILDNQFLQINGRYAVVDGQVNLDDLLVSTAHGVVRENFSGAVRDLPTPKFGAEVFQVLGLVDQQVEKRSGVSERSTGLDPSAFNSNTAATTHEMVMSAAEQKIELIARMFAETGLKSLMLGIHKLGLKFEQPGRKIRTNNGAFIPINPDEWRTRSNMTVTVGIGNGSKTHQMMQINQLMATQQALVAGGGLGTLISPTNIYNLAMEQSRILGRKDGNRFFTAPQSDEIPDQGPSMEEQVKMMQAETDRMKAQTEAQLEQQELEIKAAKQMLEEEKLELERARLAFEEKKHQDENEFRLFEAKLEAQQDRSVLIGKERPSK